VDAGDESASGKQEWGIDMKIKRRLNIVLVGFALLVIDQLTKLAVRSQVQPNSSVPVISNLFTLTFVQNTGAIFGSLRRSEEHTSELQSRCS
jgi:lipoprotein signal peptidase